MTNPYDNIKNYFAKRTCQVLGSEEVKHYAIMLPLLKIEGNIHLLFQVRSKSLKTQPGEICFPGGKIDKTDLSTEAAAKRELSEELGIPLTSIETIAPLDFLVTPFRGMIYPYLGIIHHPEQMNINKAEVDSIFTVPLEILVTMEPDCYQMELHAIPEENFPFHQIPNQEKYQQRIGKMPQYFFYFKDYVIWGLTARILHHFLTCVKEHELLAK